MYYTVIFRLANSVANYCSYNETPESRDEFPVDSCSMNNEWNTTSRTVLFNLCLEIKLK